MDAIRAAAMYFIAIDHVYPTVLHSFTYRALGYSDAAELFVLVSGFSVGLTSYGKYSRGGLRTVTQNAIGNATKIYLSALCITALILATDRVLVRSGLVISTSAVNGTWPSWYSFATLSHAKGSVQILQFYVVMILLLPIAVFLAAKRVRWLLVISIIGYAFAQIDFQYASERASVHGLNLSHTAWQCLFFVAFAFGWRVRENGGERFRPSIYLLLLAVVFFQYALFDRTLGAPVDSITLRDKESLGILRFIHVLAIGTLVFAVRIAKATRSAILQSKLVSIVLSPGRVPLVAFGITEVGSILANAMIEKLAFSMVAQIVAPFFLVIATALLSFAWFNWKSGYPQRTQAKRGQDDNASSID